ncbi:zinc-binding alcohol dehydrogenase [Streptomyces sp. NPDC102360]|uniref:zinc-dependent alcohol dehydrogenase n=1 Tax=Streptomyces sp. NPDC102360 TaxID=3366160 RepID=UPI003801283E
MEEGPADLVGRTVFSLYPHQTRFSVPAAALTPVPDGVPPERAVLAGTVETALNALWDAPPRIGDRIAVVGAGMVGCCVAALLADFPGLRVQIVDVDPARAAVAEVLGAGFAAPDRASGDRDLVFHASGTETGLRRSLELLAPEGTVADLSWYGDRQVSLPLGEFFHSRRLSLRSSQVGALPPELRGRYTLADRLALALDLLRDPRFDALITDESDFDDLPRVMAGIAAGRLPGLCHRIRYSPH